VCADTDCLHLAQARDHWRSLVNTVKNIPAVWRRRICLQPEQLLFSPFRVVLWQTIGHGRHPVHCSRRTALIFIPRHELRLCSCATGRHFTTSSSQFADQTYVLVLTVVKISMLVFWVEISCGLVGRHQSFGRTYCFHLQGCFYPEDQHRHWKIPTHVSPTLKRPWYYKKNELCKSRSSSFRNILHSWSSAKLLHGVSNPWSLLTVFLSRRKRKGASLKRKAVCVCVNGFHRYSSCSTWNGSRAKGLDHRPTFSHTG
jgi:hypothetical protein